MPKKNAHRPKPVYRQKPPGPKQNAKAQSRGEEAFHEIAPSHFKLRDDGTIQSEVGRVSPLTAAAPDLIFSHENPFVRLYHADCLTLLDAIAAKYPEGRFDAIFADPPYFLSNGGITCHAGRMVKVDKGDWDKSRGPALNHEFNLEWLRRCQRVLKPNGTIWVSGTHHVIFSIGYALQSLGYKILNDIAWEKPNPPPNLSCRYFTHSTETLLWAARDEKSKHTFNYQEMRKVTGKQMKTVWRDLFSPQEESEENENSSIWTMSAPGRDEKVHGKHPTQKPIALIERCLLASTNPGDFVLDPFLGGGTTAIAAMRLNRACVGIELDEAHAKLAAKKIKAHLAKTPDFTPPPTKNLEKPNKNDVFYSHMGRWGESSQGFNLPRSQRRWAMIEGGIGGANTLTGLNFEREVDFQTLLAAKPGYEIKPVAGKAGKGVFFKDQLVGRCFRKYDFYDFLKEEGVNWKDHLACRLMPDDALLVIVRETLFIIEVKFQQVAGSVDEKLQTCDFKRKQYQKLVVGIGLKVEYVYVLSDWFKQERYKDVLDYIISVNCNYKFNTLPLAWLGLPDPDIPTVAVEI